MSQTTEKRQRFEMLLQQAGLPQELIQTYFQDGYIDQVIVSNSNREWTFCIRKTSMVPLKAYNGLVQAARLKFEHIAAVDFQFIYDEVIETESIILQYWLLFVEQAQRENASVNGWLQKATIAVEGDVLTLSLLDNTGLELARKKRLDDDIIRFYNNSFQRVFKVKMIVSESRQEILDEYALRIVQEEREYVQELMASSQSESDLVDEAEIRLAVGYDIREEPVPLMNIIEEEKKITVQGAVFGLDMKELRNGSTLFTFNVTDFSDSIAMKMFAKTKDDVKILNQLANGKWVKARGRIEYDRFMQEPELVMMPNDLHEVKSPPDRMDKAEEKRVEFHLHTTMSAMDAVTSIDTYVKTAARWGHKAIAVTDHSNIQCYPDANKAAKKHGVKVLFGVEANIVNDAIPMVLNSRSEPLATTTYIVFDIETTGLSVINNKIIELAGVKMRDGKEIDRFSTLIDPHEKIPYHIQQLTNINDDMVKGQPDIEPKLREFIEFIGDDILVAHNARFDIGFIQANCKAFGMPEVKNPVLDTLELGRFIFPTLKNHRLNTLADKYKVSLENHHRAVDDSLALGGILYGLIASAAGGILRICISLMTMSVSTYLIRARFIVMSML